MSGNCKTISQGPLDVKLKVHSFMAGPKLAAHQNPRVTPFAQVLFGGARASGGIGISGGSGSGFNVNASETDFAVQPGGGVDINAGESFGVRVGDNYRLIRSDGETSKEFQFVVGVVLRGGR